MLKLELVTTTLALYYPVPAVNPATVAAGIVTYLVVSLSKVTPCTAA